MTERLWLVRHGATDWSDAGRLTGWTDLPLNDAGRRQAMHLGTRLAGRTFIGVWCSDLRRATDTARLALYEATPDARLRELNFGMFEGKRWEDCPRDVQEALLAFDTFRAPEGESVVDLRNRVLEFASSLSAGDHLLFTHGGVIRVLLRDQGRDALVRPGSFVRISLSAAATAPPAARLETAWGGVP